jgi:hypothetical protein
MGNQEGGEGEGKRKQEEKGGRRRQEVEGRRRGTQKQLVDYTQYRVDLPKANKDG